MGLVHLFFSFRGRINRAKYWLGWAILLVLTLPVSMLLSTVFQLALIGAIPTVLSITVLIVGLACLVAIFISGLAVVVKRLHDRNKSGWWSLLFSVAPTLFAGGGSLLKEQLDPARSIGLSLAALVIAIWAIVELGCLRGTEGDNRFGPDPLEGKRARLDGAEETPVTRGA
jgi:uncharacterized membrane protein YhaH (DUF805 family)